MPLRLAIAVLACAALSVSFGGGSEVPRDEPTVAAPVESLVRFVPLGRPPAPTLADRAIAQVSD